MERRADLFSLGVTLYKLAAGVTLYVGMSNLVPEFRARGGWHLPLAFIGGTATYFVARTVAGA